MKGKYKGENNPFYGKHHTIESRRKISENNKGMLGKKHTEETRKKISKANKGKNKGKHNSQETEFKKGHKTWNKGMKGFRGQNVSPMIYYNKKNGVWNKGKKGLQASWNKGIPMKESSKQKMIEKLKGRKVWLTGKKFPKSKYPNWGLRKTRKYQIFPKKDSSIEIKVQKLLSLLHIEYFTHHYMKIEHGYQCDILIPTQNGINQKTIIECDGCYWHACPICKLKEYTWTKKRREVDKLRTKELQEKGFRVIRLWEHDIRNMELNDFKGVLNG